MLSHWPTLPVRLAHIPCCHIDWHHLFGSPTFRVVTLIDITSSARPHSVLSHWLTSPVRLAHILCCHNDWHHQFGSPTFRVVTLTDITSSARPHPVLSQWLASPVRLAHIPCCLQALQLMHGILQLKARQSVPVYLVSLLLLQYRLPCQILLHTDCGTVDGWRNCNSYKIGWKRE
jgi:hypothetical protein